MFSVTELLISLSFEFQNFHLRFQFYRVINHWSACFLKFRSNSITEISHKVALSNSNQASASDSKCKSSASSILTSVDGPPAEARSQSRRTRMIAAFRDQIMKLKVMISCLRFSLVLCFYSSVASFQDLTSEKMKNIWKIAYYFSVNLYCFDME